MFDTSFLRRAGLLTAGLVVSVSPMAAWSQSCTISASGAAYEITPLQPFELKEQGYRLHVSVNGGQKRLVQVDTGSNVLVVPYFAVKDFPSNPMAGRGIVISDKVHYAYGSSGNNYKGYMVLVPVTVSGSDGVVANAVNVQALAVTDVCEPGGKSCSSIESNSPLGMLGIGFQPTPYLKVVNANGNSTAATQTNVISQIPDIQTVGWILQPNKITIGLNTTVTASFTSWTKMVSTEKGGFSPTGCFQVTDPSGTAAQQQCGTMLIDTGMGDMNFWVDSSAQSQSSSPICPSQSQASDAGFNGAPFPPSTTIAITSPKLSPILNDSFTLGPNAQAWAPPKAFCTVQDGIGSHSNVGRMPLALYSFARNESCGTFSFVKN